MKKKFVGIFICMLLIATTSPVVGTVNKITSQPASTTADVPTWEIGDLWTYNEHYNQFGYYDDGSMFYTWYHNCTSTYTVTDDTGDTYTVKLTSKNDEGGLIFGRYRFKFTPFTKITQEIEYRKTDLAHVRVTNQEKGFIIWLIGNIGIPLPAHFNDAWELNYVPAHEFLTFPLTAGTNGTFQSFTNTGYETISLYFGLIKLYHYEHDLEFPARNYSCEMTNITVPAGPYEAYNISTNQGSAQNFSYVYYVPEVGSYAKYSYHTELEDSGKPLENYEFELVSTTYTP